jgi:hypothetical protein
MDVMDMDCVRRCARGAAWLEAMIPRSISLTKNREVLDFELELSVEP